MKTSNISKAIWLVGILIFTGNFAASADEATIGIRPAKKIILDLPTETETIPVATAPYIDDKGVIALLPGDAIIVEFEIIDSMPKNPKVVEKNAHPERTLELSMTHDQKATIVTRKSGFAKKLTMKGRFLVLGAHSLQSANMYPLDNLPSYDGFTATAYFVEFYDFGLE